MAVKHHERDRGVPPGVKEANLVGADLEGAMADKRTGWPDGFDWRAAGLIVAGEDTPASSP
jgi:hypothetical protein